MFVRPPFNPAWGKKQFKITGQLSVLGLFGLSLLWPLPSQACKSCFSNTNHRQNIPSSVLSVFTDTETGAGPSKSTRVDSASGWAQPDEKTVPISFSLCLSKYNSEEFSLTSVYAEQRSLILFQTSLGILPSKYCKSILSLHPASDVCITF